MPDFKAGGYYKKWIEPPFFELKYWWYFKVLEVHDYAIIIMTCEVERESAPPYILSGAEPVSILEGLIKIGK